MASSEKELFMQFASLFDQGRDEEIRDLIRLKLSDNPDLASAHFWSGVVSDSKNDIEGAVASFERAIKSSPDTPLFYVSLAQSLEHKRTYGILFGSGVKDDGLNDRIVDCWKKAIELAPANVSYKCSFVEFLIGSRNFSEALDLALEARKAAPDDDIVRKSWLRANLAMGARILHESKANPRECLKAIDEVLRELPQHREARFIAGLCNLRLENLEEAIRLLEECLPPESEDRKTSISIAFGDLGKKLLEKGDLRSAERISRKGKEVDPENSKFDELLKRIKKKRAASGEVDLDRCEQTIPRSLDAATPGKDVKGQGDAGGRPGDADGQGQSQEGEAGKVFFQPFVKSLVDLVGPAIENLPADVQGLLRDLAFEVENVNLKKVRDLLSKLDEFKLSETLKTDPQKIALGKFWYFIQKKAFESSGDFLYEIYFLCLGEFSKCIEGFSHYSMLTTATAWLFEVTDQFLVSFYDIRMKNVSTLDDLLEAHAGHLSRIISSPSFNIWANRDVSRDFLKRKIVSWAGHMGNLLFNVRPRPFIVLFKLSLELQKALPDSILLPESFMLAPRFVSSEFPRSAFEEIENFLGSVCKDAPDQFNKIAGELLENLRRGGAGATEGMKADPVSVSELGDSGEPADLTVEYAYRTALEEIVGDGVITDEEKGVLRNMRTQLEISQADFQKVFEDVKARKKKNLIPVLNRDFSPEEFLFKILAKTIDDGKITREEKEIVQKICDALKLDKSMFARVFQKAKEQKAQSSVSEKSICLGGDAKLIDLYKKIEEKGKFRKIVSGEKFREAMKNFTENLSGDGRSGESPRFMAAFFYNPEILALPLLALFTPDDFSESARLQLKGGRLDFCSTGDAGQSADVKERRIVEDFLFVQNQSLDHNLMISANFNRDDIERFQSGLTASEGRYGVAVIGFPAFNPAMLARKEGYLDLTGSLYKAMNNLKSGACNEAFSDLKILNEKNPGMHDVMYYMGLCLKNLAQRGINSTKNYGDAVKYYKAELELNPGSDKSMNSMGVALKQQEKLDEAIQWLEKANEAAQSCIPILATLVTTHYNSDVMNNRVEKAVPAYLVKYLGKAFSIYPEQPLVTELVSKFSSIFQTDLRALFKYLPVDT